MQGLAGALGACSQRQPTSVALNAPVRPRFGCRRPSSEPATASQPRANAKAPGAEAPPTIDQLPPANRIALAYSLALAQLLRKQRATSRALSKSLLRVTVTALPAIYVGVVLVRLAILLLRLLLLRARRSIRAIRRRPCRRRRSGGIRCRGRCRCRTRRRGTRCRWRGRGLRYSQTCRQGRGNGEQNRTSHRSSESLHCEEIASLQCSKTSGIKKSAGNASASQRGLTI